MGSGGERSPITESGYGPNDEQHPKSPESTNERLYTRNDGTKERHRDQNQARQTDSQEAPRRVPPSANTDVSKFQMHIAELKKKIAHVEAESAEDKDRCAQSLEQLKTRLEASERRRQQAELDFSNAMAECGKLSRDNVALREYIDVTRHRQPIYSDDEYIARIERLNEQTKSWIATLSKSQKTANVQQDMSAILPALDQNNYGRAFASVLQENPNMFERILESRQRRSSLIRQFIWCEFSEVIFRPFCFGLTDDVSDLLSRTMRTIRGVGEFPGVWFVDPALTR